MALAMGATTRNALVFTFAPETDADRWEVEALFDLCFAPGRSALSSYRLRDGVEPLKNLSLVARDADGIAAGAIRFWPVRIKPVRIDKGAGQGQVQGQGQGARTLLLGPIAVHPTHQGEGLGGMLMLESLELAAKNGWARVMLVGDAPYYGRFGFVRLDGVEMPPPTNPDRVLGLDLCAPGWAGIRGKVTRDA